MRNENLVKSRVSEIHAKRIRVNQGVGVYFLIEAGAHKCINKLFMYLYGRDESLSWIKHLGCRMRRLFWSNEPRSVKIGHTV